MDENPDAYCPYCLGQVVVIERTGVILCNRCKRVQYNPEWEVSQKKLRRISREREIKLIYNNGKSIFPVWKIRLLVFKERFKVFLKKIFKE